MPGIKGEITDFTGTLTYNSYRGQWYRSSWKGRRASSGGVLYNLGIHLIDALQWIFGRPTEVELFVEDDSGAGGVFHWGDKGSIRWLLSTNGEGQKRELSLAAGPKIDFTTGINLHPSFYSTVLAGTSTGIADALPAIELIEALRESL